MTYDADAWRRALALAIDDPASGPEQVSRLCVERLDIEGAGVAMATAAGNRAVICATDERASRIEDLQFTLGEGPCVDAFEHGHAVLVPDLHEPGDLAVERWPTFMTEAGALGVRAVFALPLRIGAISIGAVDFYRTRPGVLTVGDLALAWMAADAIAASLLTGTLASPLGASDDPLVPPYDVHIHQATGMVQVQLGVEAKQALLQLRARAFAESRPLTEVCADVVARRLRFTMEDRHDGTP